MDKMTLAVLSIREATNVLNRLQSTAPLYSSCLKSRLSLQHLIKGTVSRDWYFFVGLSILISTSLYAPIVFKVFQIMNFLFASLKLLYLLILKMLNEAFLIIPFSVIGRWSPASSPHWLQGKCVKLTCQRWLSVWFLQDHSNLHFQVQKLLF